VSNHDLKSGTSTATACSTIERVALCEVMRAAPGGAAVSGEPRLRFKRFHLGNFIRCRM
jgi:hypothetical protein